MWIVRVRVPNTDALKSASAIVRGDAVSAKREEKGFVAELVVREEEQLEKLRALDAGLEIRFDSRTRPDPKDQVSKVDRYAEELARLKREKGKA